MMWAFGLFVLATLAWSAIELRNAPTDVELWGKEIE